MRSKEFRNLITNIALRGPDAVPRCPHALDCGGCAFQDRAYDHQVAAKAQVLNELWADVWTGPAIQVVPSPDPYNYRTRMDYVSTKQRFGLRRRGRFNYIVELEECHLIPPSAFAVAHLLWLRSQELRLPDYNFRSHEGFLRYIVVRRSPEDGLLLAAVTAAGPYEAEMEQLAALALAQPGVLSFHWLINDTLTDVSFGTPLRHWGTATLPMQVGTRTLHIGPNTFFQNNVHLLIPLLEDIQSAVTEQKAESRRQKAEDELKAESRKQEAEDKQSISDESSEHCANSDRNAILPSAFCLLPSGKVADLYGGVGTIALHLADAVDEIVTVESVAESAELARHNIALNSVNNITGVCADVLLWLHDQEPGSLDVVVLDPPRTGLGPEVCAELLRLAPQRIVYVSCNPLTQLDDVRLLGASYELRSLRGYDMFPHTPHVEALGVLEKTKV